MPQKANDCHNHLKLKTKAQICYFFAFLVILFPKNLVFPASPPLKGT